MLENKLETRLVRKTGESGERQGGGGRESFVGEGGSSRCRLGLRGRPGHGENRK